MSIAKKLEAIANQSIYAKGNNAVTILWSYRLFAPYFHNGNVLELGPAEGLGTQILTDLFDEIHCVDGSETFCRLVAEKFPALNVTCSLFEEFEPDRSFDNIVLGHVLEHVGDPVAILEKCRSWLRPGGRLFAAVPNARSLHRQAAVIMGLIRCEDELSAKDVAHGHLRVYDPESFRSTLMAAQFRLIHFGGYWLKPLSDAQIERHWTREMLLAFMELGERYPDVAAELFAICEAADPKPCPGQSQ